MTAFTEMHNVGMLYFSHGGKPDYFTTIGHCKVGNGLYGGRAYFLAGDLLAE